MSWYIINILFVNTTKDTEIDPRVANTFSNDCTAAGYHFEYGNRRAVVDPDTYFIEDSDNDIPYFKNQFQGRCKYQFSDISHFL